MLSIKAIVLIAATLIVCSESSGVPVAAALAAPLVAPAHVGYAHTVPQNVPPFASQVNVVSKALASPLVAGPALAAPVAAPFAAAYAAAPLAATPFAASPLIAGPAAALPAPYAAQYAAQYALPAPGVLSAAPPAFAAAPPGFAAAPAAYAAAPAAYAAPYPYAGPAPLVRSPLGLAPALWR